MEIEVDEDFEEKRVTDSVKGLGEVGRGDHSAHRRFLLIKTRRNASDKGKKGGGGRPTMAKAMLGR